MRVKNKDVNEELKGRRAPEANGNIFKEILKKKPKTNEEAGGRY